MESITLAKLLCLIVLKACIEAMLLKKENFSLEFMMILPSFVILQLIREVSELLYNIAQNIFYVLSL